MSVHDEARFVGNVRLKITFVRSSGDTNEGVQTQYAMARRMRPKQIALSIR